jgi:hypothetical protein
MVGIFFAWFGVTFMSGVFLTHCRRDGTGVGR